MRGRAVFIICVTRKLQRILDAALLSGALDDEMLTVRSRDLHGRDLLRFGRLNGYQADLIEGALNAKD
jgi:hypothetical protein